MRPRRLGGSIPCKMPRGPAGGRAGGAPRPRSVPRRSPRRPGAPGPSDTRHGSSVASYLTASTKSARSPRSPRSPSPERPWKLDLVDPVDMVDLVDVVIKRSTRRSSERGEFRRGHRLGQLIQVAVHHRIQVVKGQADAVVGDTVLGKVVGANLLTALAGPHLQAALLRDGLLLAMDLLFQEFGPQGAHRFFAVLMLRPLILAGHHEAGGEVVDPHGGFHLVHVLAPGAAGPVCFDLDLVSPDPHVHL